MVVALKLIPPPKSLFGNDVSYGNIRKPNHHSAEQPHTHLAKISLIKCGSLLTFIVEWSRYVHWAHSESQGGALIKVLSPIGRGSRSRYFETRDDQNSN